MDEARALLALARVLLTSVSLAKDSAATELTIERAKEILDSTGARAYEPQLLEVRAELARAVGDGEEHDHLRREALHLCREMGATGHATRLAKDLSG